MKICVNLWMKLLWLFFVAGVSAAQPIVLRPAAVFDGQEMHPGWSVLVADDKIAGVGPDISVPPETRTVELPNETLLPGAGLCQKHSCAR